jgi:1,5-anhydro-D-fructose reductase (1,5-anhydro-D-mannitol-forming)
MIRVGIVGYGKMGQIRHEAVSAGGSWKVVGIVEPHLKSPPPDVQVFTSPSELITSPQIDAVFICTPNYLNKPLTIEALKQGKHVFCEKPPAFTASDIEEIMAVEKASGKKLMYGFNHRHHDSIIKAKELVDSDVYGRLLWMRGRYGKSVDASFYENWRSKKELAGGGILIDQGIHMLDLFLYMGGDFEDVQAYVSNLYWHLEVEDNVFAILRNAQGTVASLHSTMSQWRHLFSFEMFLEKGYIVINGLLTSSGTYGRETMTIAKNRTAAPAATWSDEEDLHFDINNSWAYEAQHFLSAIENNTPVAIGHSQDAYKLMRIIDKIYQNPRKERVLHERATLAQ